MRVFAELPAHGDHLVAVGWIEPALRRRLAFGNGDADRIRPTLHFRGDVVGERVRGEVHQRLLDVAVGNVELGVGGTRLSRRGRDSSARLLERQSRGLLIERRRLRQILEIGAKSVGDLPRIARIGDPQVVAQHIVDSQRYGVRGAAAWPAARSAPLAGA
jgi:hypothetical protein